MITHQSAELLRLEKGIEGCGCADCQEFYQTLDLSVYGRRVKSYAGVIIITEKVREKEKQPTKTSVAPVLTHCSQNLGVSKVPPEGLVVGRPVTFLPKPSKSPVRVRKLGRPRKIGQDISKVTRWRRRREILKQQGALI